MCLICMHCGKCPGFDQGPDILGIADRPLHCLKCGAEIPLGSDACPSCGAIALVPPGESVVDSGSSPA